MEDTRILVTGASGDIGRAIAKALLQAGAEVVLLGRRPDFQLWNGLPEARHKPVCLAVDLTDPAAVEQHAAKIAAAGRLDALVLSSGIYHRSRQPVVFRHQLEVNLIGPYALLRLLLPDLIESRGQIVFINSSQALRASADVDQYAATKHALKAIADGLRDEVNERGVRVMSVYLGRTAGERQRDIFAMERREYRPERLIQPDDVAHLVCHLMQMPRTAEVTDIMVRPMQRV
jgi:NADP-dependent 3-hydroxy acid dehydrogenase YdfG